ncbi:hypothetical protein [Stygiolobus sp. RP850M]|uniref:hypothetical protein n=1 Tax=Stygiolobus sp. RP850M TaxID=3133137 RepID=UPI00307DF998
MNLLSYDFEPSQVITEFSLFSIFYSSILVATSIFNTRFGMVSKSDSDFLAMLPIDDRMLVTSVIIGSIVSNLALSILFVSLFVLSIGLYGIFIPFLLSLISASLPAITYSLSIKRKVLVALGIAGWFLLAGVGFPFSPMSMFVGYDTIGFSLLITLSLSSFFLAIKRFSFTNYSNIIITSEKGEVKEQINFTKVRYPLLVMLVKNLNVLEVGGRANFMGTTTYVTKRVKLWQILLITSLMGAMIYFAYTLKIGFFSLNFYVIIITWFLTVLLSSSALISEPIWLDMNVMTPLEFFRNYLISKAIALAVVLLPIGLFEVLSSQVVLGLTVMVDLPLGSIFVMSLNSRFYRASFQNIQITTAGRSLVSFLSIIIPLDVLEVIAFLPYLSVLIIGTVVLLVLDLPFFLSSSYWQSTVEKIMTSVT